MADQATLTGLSSREEVADALHRCLLGVDSNNKDLFASACLKNEEINIVAGPVNVKGWTAVQEFFNKVFDLTTTHIASNVRVELRDGAERASLTCHVVAYHVRPEEAFKPEDTSYTMSSLNDMELVMDNADGLWKIKSWKLKALWTTGDRAIIHG